MKFLTYKIFEDLGPYVGLDSKDIPEKLLVILEEASYNSRVIIDFKGVLMISPVFLSVIILQCLKRKNVFGLIAKDPNRDVRLTFKLCLQKTPLLVLAIYSDNAESSKSSEILKIQHSMKRVYDIVKKHQPIGSHDVAERLEKAGWKASSARELLRRLHRQGVITRKGYELSEGRIGFIYSILKPEIES